MTEPTAPKIEFPLDYGIKVVANSVDGFHSAMVAIVRQHDPHFDVTSIVISESKNGNYQSYRMRIWATGEPQLKALFEDLKDTGEVHFVL
ncbi:DUF493 family protein [Litorivicinus lipolyticus]|jgi:uncharacterized protein|uniref:DUF493 family protein n=1 Tax=Litorivicinus lipolyticus TaxID=418701 RepID=A0A5Q2Q9S0_9GAMM|nr:DUF493 domain-containing protein [Litorivicinus lipolyticus]QGG81038.1 DUF493 family protein [Litorivicinus lipolyticus]